MSWLTPFDAPLGWQITLTLVHLTWIGLVLAWLAGKAKRRMGQASPNWRFRINLAALLLFCLSLPITFGIVRSLVTREKDPAELQADGPPDPNQTFIAELPDGTAVELIAISYNPSDGRPWWKPNGALLAAPPRERSGIQQSISIKKGISGGSMPQAEYREFCVRIVGLGNNLSTMQFESGAGSVSSRSWKPPEMIHESTAGPFKNSKAASVSVALTSGDWGPWQLISPSGKLQDIGPLAEEFRDVYGRVKLQKVTAKATETSLLLALDNPLFRDGEFEVFAVGLDGERHHAPRASFTTNSSEHTFSLPREKIDHLQYRLRPYRQRVTFENVSLEPQQNSKVSIRITSNVAPRPYFRADLIQERKIVFKGKTDPSHEIVVRINKEGKPIEWRTSASLGEIEVTIEASNKLNLQNDKDKLDHGFISTVKQCGGTGTTYHSLTKGNPLAGTFVIRKAADLVTKDGVHTFADVLLRDGKKVPVSVSVEPKKEMNTP